MFKKTINWLDDKTNCKKIIGAVCYENIPGGPKWRHVWGSTILFAFLLECITGTLLATAYSPSAHTAWESVYYIQHQMSLGWLIRGIHFYASQALVILIVIHLFMLVIYRAYTGNRDFRFWLILTMIPVFFGFGLTGYLLPWDQMGYWATTVRAGLITSIPVIGEPIQTIIQGGSQFGHHTLTRFYTLHVIVLPLIMIALMSLYYIAGKRTGIYPGKSNPQKNTTYFPKQATRDAIASLMVLAGIILVLFAWGVPLEAPANPAESFDAARPEWYFISVFILLKFVPTLVGFVIIPTAIQCIMGLMPTLGKFKKGHAFNIAFLITLFIAALALSLYSLNKDSKDPKYQHAHHEAQIAAKRTKFLAQEGFPIGGALDLLRKDPFTQGRKIFAQNCASCHAWADTDGTTKKINLAQTSAPNLQGFGTKKWLTGFLDPKQIDTHQYWGNTKFGTKQNNNKPPKGGMVKIVKEAHQDIAQLDPKDPDDAEEIQEYNQGLSAIIAYMASKAYPLSPESLTDQQKKQIQKGWDLLDENDLFTCADCHKFDKIKGSSKAVDLTNWASEKWTTDFINNPSDKRFYGKDNDRMPAFHNDQILTPKEIKLLVQWMRNQYKPTPKNNKHPKT